MIDININDKFGRLTIIKELDERTKQRGRIYLCECECGNIIKVPRASLVTGNTRSCGCLQKEIAKQNGKKNIKYVNKRAGLKNKYDLTGDYGIGFLEDGITQFYFDLEDYDLIKDFLWHTKEDNIYCYLITNIHGKQVRFHRLILNCTDPSKVIDHINHNPLDNRKCNLRICEHYENIIASKPYSNNTSGRKGVYWDKSRNKWMVCITKNKKTYHLGRYDDFDEAVRVREQAEKELHKEFHYDG